MSRLVLPTVSRPILAYAYLSQKSPDVVAASLAKWPWSRGLVPPLQTLFTARSSPGTRDVLDYAGTLDDVQKELVARDVVDLFAELFAAFEKLA